MAQKSAPPITIQHVAIADLRPDPRNPRVMPELERDALDRSIDEFGLVEPVVVHRSTNRIVGGHRRVESAIRNGFVEVPVVFVDVTDEQADVLSLALNRIHGEWDNKLLARMLADLQNLPEVDISLTGFDDDEIKKQLRSLEARASGTASRPSTWTPHLNARSPDVSNWARCGNSAKADSCVATPPIRLTLRHCWATRGRVWQSPTRRTTLHWETTAVARAASAADGSAMTNFRPNSGRPLSADLRPTCWRILTGRSTASCPARNCRSFRVFSPKKAVTGQTRSSGKRTGLSLVARIISGSTSRFGTGGGGRQTPLVRGPGPGRRLADRSTTGV